jgi:hypothetical protein
VGISSPSSPLGPTLESCLVSVKVYLVYNMAHASRALSRHADLFQIRKHFVASLIFSMRSVIRLGVSSSGHNTEHILPSARRARWWTSWIFDTTSWPNELNSDIDHPVSMTVYKMQKLAPRTVRVFSNYPDQTFHTYWKGSPLFSGSHLETTSVGPSDPLSAGSVR